MDNEGGIRPALNIDLKSSLFAIDNKTGEQTITVRTPMFIVRSGVLVKVNPSAEIIHLPAYIREIASGAVDRCHYLTGITWDNENMVIHRNSFNDCNRLRLPAYLYNTEKRILDYLVPYMPDDDPEVLANVFYYQTETLWLENVSTKLKIENISSVTESLLMLVEKDGKKDLNKLEKILRFALMAAPELKSDQLERCRNVTTALRVTHLLYWLDTEIEVNKTESSSVFVPDTDLLKCNIEKIDAEQEVIFKASGISLNRIRRASQPYRTMFMDGYVGSSDYRKAFLLSYERDAAADATAEKMEHEVFLNAMYEWAKTDPSWYAPYAVYARDDELAVLIKETNTWTKEGKIGKTRIIRIRGAIMLNDTKTAMRYADSLGLLGQYAKMRGTDEDSIRDTVISEFGLDENGEKIWELGGRIVKAVLSEELKLELYDLGDPGAPKAVKTIPKKNSDPAAYEAANNELKEMRKGIKEAVKLRNRKLFSDFLSGKTVTAETWKGSYLKNPLLRTMARLIVWEQDGDLFTVSGAETIDVEGNTYNVTEKPIRVAHPMDMSPESIGNWQHYFNDRALKQPFAQVWEPVLDGNTIKPDRYKDCTIAQYMLMNKERDGIQMSGSRLELKDCSAKIELKESSKDWINNQYEITNFRFSKFNRQVNHIAVHFDKGTVRSRVLKDDISVAMWLDNFTFAQIREFIDLAADNHCPNVTALLLEYQREHFETFDPMAQFLLDDL